MVAVVKKWTADRDTVTNISIQVKKSTQLPIYIQNMEGLQGNIKCALFFYGMKKTVDRTTFKAINDCCLVYDRGLIIDKHFRTHDPAM